MKGKSKPNPFDNLFAPEQPEPESTPTSTAPSKVKGKKSNKDYVAAMTYLPKRLKLDVQQQLLDLQRTGIDIDFSELVAELLSLHLDIQKGDNPDICISRYLDRLNNEYPES